MSFIVFPSIEDYLNSPRISFDGNKPSIFEYLHFFPGSFLNNEFLRLFSNNFLGNHESYFGQLNYYESPQIYSSLLVLLFLPQALFIKNICKQKVSIVLGLLLFVIFFVFFSFFIIHI
jgi:hypothetical protein